MKLIISFSLALLCLFAKAQENISKSFDKGVTELRSGKYSQSVTTFTDVINKATIPEMKKMAYIYRGFSYNGLNEHTKAINDFSEAIKLDPDDLASYIDRGKTYGMMNEDESASKDFEYVLKHDSTGEQAQAALFYKGLIAYQNGKYPEAIGFYDRYIRLVPDDPEAYFNRGAAKGMLLKDLEGSIIDYTKAIELNPKYAEAYANRGVAKINMFTTRGTLFPTKEQTKSACEDLKKARSLGDNTVEDMIYVHCDKK